MKKKNNQKYGERSNNKERYEASSTQLFSKVKKDPQEKFILKTPLFV